MQISGGVITLTGTVDGVDLSTLESRVLDHAAEHPISGSVDSTTETITAPSGQFYTAYNSSGGGAGWDTSVPVPATRAHSHGAGTLEANGTTPSTGQTPSGTQVKVYANTGSIECKTADGVCPYDLWLKYRSHEHGMAGDTGATAPGALSMRGARGASYTWYRVSYYADGSSPFWAEVETSNPTHTHPAGTLELSAMNYSGPPTASTPPVELDALNDEIRLGGNVNGVDVSAFKSQFDAHQHQGAGNTGTGGGSTSVLRNKANGQVVYFLRWPGNVWELCYMTADPGANHTHGGTGLWGT